MSRDNLIVAQCAFKGAIDLAVANKITVEEINNVTLQFADAMINVYGNGTSTAVTPSAPAKPVYKPADNYKPAKTANKDAKPANPKAPASDKQKNFIISLIKELPLAQQDGYNQLVTPNMNMGVASDLITKLKETIDGNVPQAKQHTAPDVAPF
jgi:hypothetical protein